MEEPVVGTLLLFALAYAIAFVVGGSRRVRFDVMAWAVAVIVTVALVVIIVATDAKGFNLSFV